MFYQLLYIHLFRPFLKYSQATSPLPTNVSPRRLCTQAAAAISKLLRLYKRSHGLRQICNIAVYIAHSACTIHLLNLPDKNAKRDITHGVKHLEEIAESWLCARRTLAILSVLSRQWNVELPDEAEAVLARTDVKFAHWNKDIQSRYPSKRPSLSPEQASPQQEIVQTSPNFFNSCAANGKVMASPTAFPPQNAADLLVRHASITTTPVNQISNTVSTPASLASMDNSNSPSAIFGTMEHIPRADGGDWWFRDQNQLAQGFAQWSADDPATWGHTMPTSPQMHSNGMVVDDQSLSQLFGMNGIGMPQGMAYPNESEWYQ